MKPTHFSLFTGIGGIDLAAEWAGFETVGQCEYADYQTKVLEKHWPDVPRWRDIRDVTRESVKGEITLLSGGFPCQPHSLAGKRRASEDERELWGEMFRVICELRPKWVLGENVAGLLSSEAGRFFGRVLRDLASVGYSVGWCCYGARDVGAPHRRDRVFIVANTKGTRDSKQQIVYREQQRKTAGTYKCGQQSGGLAIADQRENKSMLGRNANGIPHRMDWPAGYKEKQKEWEPPRIINECSDREKRLQCLGNAVVPQQVYPILKAIYEIETGGQVYD